ncbi:voltage-dependent calcium channel unc-36 [Plakobranchus ocellatus]|uniref:Voltage-dependent calcium channel unc-36 n=1 Tax=Plakobranchus ocellatus TaxID=259542 RepID=A0AAV4AXU5_9GAST|nr:voltage-dependent calcium channel unc-36 [Plakobranchus ocellatus]
MSYSQLGASGCLSKRGSDKVQLLQQRAAMMTERDLHHGKAENFYTTKHTAKTRAQIDTTTMTIAFVFQKELQCPNKSTNDIYHRRTLSLHSFNIHALATDSVHIFAYDDIT